MNFWSLSERHVLRFCTFVLKELKGPDPIEPFELDLAVEEPS